MRDLAKRLSALYLGTFLLLGFALAFILPPFQAPDESEHWSAAFVRTERLVSGNSEVCSIALGLPEFFGTKKIVFNTEQKILSARYDKIDEAPLKCSADAVNYGGILSYPGYLISRILLFGAAEQPKYMILQFYLSRLIHGLILFGVLFRFWWLAFRAPRQDGSIAVSAGATTLFTFVLSPLFVQQSFALSSDVTTNAFAISLITFLVYWKNLARLDWTLFALLGFSACTTKPTILPAMVAVVFAIFVFHGRDWKARFWQWRAKSLRALAALSILLSIVTFSNTASRLMVGGEGASPQAQKAFVLENPVFATKVIALGIWDRVHSSHLHGPLGWLDTYIPTHLRNIWRLLIAFAIFLDLFLITSLHGTIRSVVSSILPRLLGFVSVCAGIAVSSFLVGYAMYLVFTPVGAAYVGGIQGRYFFASYILLIGAAAAALSWSSERNRDSVLPKWATLSVLCLVGYVQLFSIAKTLVAVAQRYW